MNVDMRADLARRFADDDGRESCAYQSCFERNLNVARYAKEVIKISGNSPLAIRVMFPAGNEATDKFFLSLLNDNWERIRSFHVLVHQGWRFGHGTLDINQGIALVNIIR